MIIAPLAARDLDGLHRYLAETAGLEAADKFADDLSAKLKWLALSGTMGVPRNSLRPGLRMSIFKKRAIYFRVTDRECRIVRIVHTRQHIEDQSFDA